MLINRRYDQQYLWQEAMPTTSTNSTNHATSEGQNRQRKLLIWEWLGRISALVGIVSPVVAFFFWRSSADTMVVTVIAEQTLFCSFACFFFFAHAQGMRRDIRIASEQHRSELLALSDAHSKEIAGIEKRHSSDVASLARSARHANAFRKLYACVRAIGETLQRVQKRQISDEDVDRKLTEVLADLASYYSQVTSQPVRACIKRVDPDENVRSSRAKRRANADPTQYMFVSTQARDAFTRDRGDHDPDDVASEEHRIGDNTDFKFLYKPTSDEFKWYWFSNNLPQEYRVHRYENSRLRNKDAATDEIWPLKYRSTIVWPIRRLEGTRDELTKSGPRTITSQSVAGYLCIDSPDTDVFDEQTDILPGKIISEYLFILLATWVEMSEENTNE